MRYEYLQDNDEGVKIFARIDDDGKCRVTCTENNPDYLRWLNGEEENGTIS
jgi:hypothetical protein